MLAACQRDDKGFVFTFEVTRIVKDIALTFNIVFLTFVKVYGLHGILDIQMTGVELKNRVTDILDYAALESGNLELNPRIYNITSTLNDVMNTTTTRNDVCT